MACRVHWRRAADARMCLLGICCAALASAGMLWGVVRAEDSTLMAKKPVATPTRQEIWDGYLAAKNSVTTGEADGGESKTSQEVTAPKSKPLPAKEEATETKATGGLPKAQQKTEVPLVEARPIVAANARGRTSELPPIVTPQTLQRPSRAPIQRPAPGQASPAEAQATGQLAPVVSAAQARNRKGSAAPNSFEPQPGSVQQVMSGQTSAADTSSAPKFKVLPAEHASPGGQSPAASKQFAVPSIEYPGPNAGIDASYSAPSAPFAVTGAQFPAPNTPSPFSNPHSPVADSSPSGVAPPNSLRPAIIDNPLVTARKSAEPKEMVEQKPVPPIAPQVLRNELAAPGTLNPAPIAAVAPPMETGAENSQLQFPTTPLSGPSEHPPSPSAAALPNPTKSPVSEQPPLISPPPAPSPAVIPAKATRIEAAEPPALRPKLPAPRSKSPASGEPGVQTAHLLQPPPAGPAAPPALEPAAEPQLELPAGSPFEAISESGTIRLRVRKSLLMRTKVDVYRTATVDEGVVELVQFTPREISLIGRSQGQTHVTFWFDDPAQPPVTYVVEVAPDAQEIQVQEEKYKLLENVINEMFPDSKVYLVLVADKLLVKGQARDSEEAAQIMTIIRAQAGGLRGGVGGLTEGAATPVLSLAASGGNPGQAYTIINMLRVPGVQQVALKVKIAELNRTAARGFGVDVAAAIDIGSSSELIVASVLNAIGGGGTSLIASLDGGDINIGLRYLQERGVIRLLSEPTLVTLSGRPATFIAGGEFAVPTVVGSVGLNAVTTDFRAFGAIISFVPTVVDKDRIRLQVAPEFSQINSDLAVGGTPGLNVRAATTTVEMREGQTLAIAGLLEDSYNATAVGDLPFLAQLFGRRDTARNETELIILVTPELVQPMEPEEVPPLPGFDVTEPTASEFFLGAHLEGNPTRDHRSTVWPRLRRRYGMGGPAMTSGPFGHGQ